MSHPGNCWDNAVVECLYATLKTELLQGRQYHTRQEANVEIFEYLEGFYNRHHHHSALNFMNPVEFELQDTKSKVGVYETGGSPVYLGRFSCHTPLLANFGTYQQKAAL